MSDVLVLIRSNLVSLWQEAHVVSNNQKELRDLAIEVKEIVDPLLRQEYQQLDKEVKGLVDVAINELCCILSALRVFIQKKGKTRSGEPLPLDRLLGSTSKLEAELAGKRSEVFSVVQRLMRALAGYVAGEEGEEVEKLMFGNNPTYSKMKAAVDGDVSQAEEQAWALDPSKLQVETSGRGKPKRILGTGGFAVVYHARYEGAEVAVLEPHDPQVFDGDVSMRKEFLRETKLLFSMSHLNVVRLVGAILSDEHGDPWYLLLTEMQQQPLDRFVDLILKPADASEQEARGRAVIQGLANGLAYLHLLGMVHGDLQPKNVMVEADDMAKLVGFELHKTRQLIARATGSVKQGDLCWMSPKQRTGGTASFASDVYSLGLVMMYVMTREKPPASREEQAEVLKGLPGDQVWKQLSLCCLDYDELTRPTAAAVAISLLVDRNQMLPPLPPRTSADQARVETSINRHLHSRVNPVLTSSPFAREDASVYTTWGEIRCFTDHTSKIKNVMVSPKLEVIAALTDDAALRTWEPSSGNEVRCFKGQGRSITLLASISLNVSGSYQYCIVAGSSDGTVRAWEASSGQQVWCFKGQGSSITCLSSISLNVSGRYQYCIFAGSSDGTVRAWEASSGNEVWCFKGQGRSITCLALTSLNVSESFQYRIVAGSSDGTVRAWEPSSGQQVWCFKGQGSSITCLALTNVSGRYQDWMVAGSSDGTVRAWEASSGNEVWCTEEDENSIISVMWSEEGGMMIAAGASDFTVRAWEEPGGKEIGHFEGNVSVVRKVAWSKDGKLIAALSWDSSVRVWERSSCKQIRCLQGHRLTRIAWSNDGSMLATHTSEGQVSVCDMSSGEMLRCFEEHLVIVTDATWSQDDKLLAAGSSDFTVRVWEVRSSKQWRWLKGHQDQVTGVAWSRDGSMLASRSEDKTVRVWEMSSGRRVSCCTGHEGSVTCLAWTRDGSFLASGSSDCTVRVWEARSGKEIKCFRGHTKSVTDVAWSEDGSMLVSGSDDTTVLVWGSL